MNDEQRHPLPGSTWGASFLRRPDHFERLLEAEPCGPEARRIDLAGGPYLVEGLSAEQRAVLDDRFGPEPPAGESNDAPVVLRLVRGTRQAFLTAHEVVAPHPEGWHYTFDRFPTRTSLRLAGLGFASSTALGEAIDAPGSPTETVVATPYTTDLEHGGDDFGCAFANVLRTLVAYRLLALGGVLLHSAGVTTPAPRIEDARVDVFVGHSGAGKSTLSRRALDAGRHVLSDDMNALVPAGGLAAEPDTYRVEKLPFTGDLREVLRRHDRDAARTAPVRLPLRHIARLHKGPTALRAVRRAPAVAFLTTCAPFVNDDPHRADRLIGILDRLTARHPLLDLHVSLDEDPFARLDGERRDPAAGG